MESKNTFILADTEAFMRGELDNVTVANNHISLDLVQGGHVPYGCYTSPAVPMPLFDALRVSWNALTPPGTAVEAQARVLLDGNWTAWSSFGRWSPYIARTGAAPLARGPLVLQPEYLSLDSKCSTQIQLRIYLYTKDDKCTPTVRLLAGSVRMVDVIPAGGRPIHTNLHLMPYAVARRAPMLRPVMDVAACLAGLANRWWADILPEELALAMWDHQQDQSRRNLSFAAAAIGCWGFPAWVGWADLAQLRSEVRAGFGVLVELQSTPAEQKRGLPPLRCALLRGFENDAGATLALLTDPFAAPTDFECELSLPVDEFLVAWDNVALFMHKAVEKPGEGGPVRANTWVRHLPDDAPGLYRLFVNSAPHDLPPDFCGSEDAPTGVLAWSVPDPEPHATTAHRTLHFVEPEENGIRLARQGEQMQKCTVYAVDQTGSMLVGDVTL